VRNSNLVLIKKDLSGAKQRQQNHHGWHNANKIRIFITGEVLPIDIDRLMGAIILIITKINITAHMLYPYQMSFHPRH